jgi:hypothetical protein
MMRFESVSPFFPEKNLRLMGFDVADVRKRSTSNDLEEKFFNNEKSLQTFFLLFFLPFPRQSFRGTTFPCCFVRHELLRVVLRYTKSISASRLPSKLSKEALNVQIQFLIALKIRDKFSKDKNRSI